MKLRHSHSRSRSTGTRMRVRVRVRSTTRSGASTGVVKPSATVCARLFYSLVNFSSADAEFIDACTRNTQGWRSMRVDIVPAGKPESSSTASASVPFCDCVVHLTPAATMRVLYPQPYLRGLSVTDRRAYPVKIHIHEDNWLRIPPTSDYVDLALYREHLVNHEFGHAIGFDHAPFDAKHGGRCDVMFQPSKSLNGATPNPFVNGWTSAPYASVSLAAIITAPRIDRSTESSDKGRSRS